jgi:hypothetical protein
MTVPVMVSGKIIAEDIDLVEVEEARNLYGDGVFFQHDFFVNLWKEQAAKLNFGLVFKENVDKSWRVDSINFDSIEDYLLCLMINCR